VELLALIVRRSYYAAVALGRVVNDDGSDRYLARFEGGFGLAERKSHELFVCLARMEQIGGRHSRYNFQNRYGDSEGISPPNRIVRLVALSC
jgi:hypothetical protein